MCSTLLRRRRYVGFERAEALPDGSLVGIERVATLTTAVSALVPLIMFMDEARVQRQQRGRAASDAPLRDRIPAS